MPKISEDTHSPNCTTRILIRLNLLVFFSVMFCISYRFLSDISLSDRIMLLTTCKALGITEVPLWAVIRLTKPGRSHTTTFNTESSTSIPNRICHSLLNYFVLFSICSLQLPMLYMIAHSVRHMALNAHKSSKNFNILKQHSLYWISAGGKCIVGIFFLPFPPFLYHFHALVTLCPRYSDKPSKYKNLKVKFIICNTLKRC